MAFACLAALLLVADAVIPLRCNAADGVGCYTAWSDGNSYSGPFQPAWLDVTVHENHLVVFTVNETGADMADLPGVGYGVAFASPYDEQHQNYAAFAGFMEPNQPALTTFTAFTFVAWVYLHDFMSTGTGTFFSIAGTDADASCANRVVFDLFGYREYHCGQEDFSTAFSNSFQFQLDHWYMVALVRDGYDVRMYAYGVGADTTQGLIGIGTSPLNVAYYSADSTYFSLGRDEYLPYEANSFFEGSMSFVGLWNAALSVDDLLDIIGDTQSQSVSYVPDSVPPAPLLPTDFLPQPPVYNTFRDYWFHDMSWVRFQDWIADTRGGDYEDYFFYNHPSLFSDYVYANSPDRQRWTEPLGQRGAGLGFFEGHGIHRETDVLGPAPAPAPEGSPELSVPRPTIRGCCRANTFRGNDDSSTYVLLPFEISFFGEVTNGVWLNNNGNVAPYTQLSTFTPDPLVGNSIPVRASVRERPGCSRLLMRYPFAPRRSLRRFGLTLTRAFTTR